ncbi:MAG: LysM peptidoglycan-binding domain-containing protein [Ruminococcus sp.]|nr:LysM peptidoglycan-binding domain-containing protein [Ruminococcus sp.]
MARQLPKNVRQIGNVNDSPKIYVEDYVDTFFSQLCEKSGEEAVGAFLIGDFQKTEEEEYVYIYGAVRMHELKMDGMDYVVDEDTWKKAYEDCKQYFEDGEMLGWFIARPGAVLKLEKNMAKLHKKSFPKKNTICILKDSIEKDEMYYVHKFNDLLPIEGHYTYYEKNPCMQNYMISTRKKNGATPTETVEDRAAKDFRGAIRLREERMQQRRAARAMYSFSACLVLIVVIMGVVTLNNADKMRSVQDGLDALTGQTTAQGDGDKGGTSPDKQGGDGQEGDGKEADGQVVETSGNVKAVTGKDASGKDGSQDASEDGEGKDGADGQAAGDGNDGQAGSDGNGGQAAGDGNGGQAASDGNGGQAAGDGNGGQAASDGNGGQAAGDENGGQENGDGIYEVQQGDTLALISKKVYGDISHIDEICRVNGLEDGNLIFIGQKLVLP